MIEKDVESKCRFSPEAHEWVLKWSPNIDVWLKNAVGFTELYFAKDSGKNHDWKALIQQLMSILEGVEIAAREANNIPHSVEDQPRDMVSLLIHSINYVNDRCKEMKELLPTLE